MHGGGLPYKSDGNAPRTFLKVGNVDLVNVFEFDEKSFIP